MDVTLGRTHHVLLGAVFQAEAPTKTRLWHDRLGHLGTTMLRRKFHYWTATYSVPAMLKDLEVAALTPKANLASKLQSGNYLQNSHQRWSNFKMKCVAPIVPASCPFQYFFVLMDALGQYIDLSLLSTCNIVFSKLLAMLLKL